MKRATLDDLRRESPWPDRLEGTSEWSVPKRTAEKVMQEYEVEKWGFLANFITRPPEEALRAVQDHLWIQDVVVISTGDDLWSLPAPQGQEKRLELMARTLEPLLRPETTLVELGCGPGLNLVWASERFGLKHVVGGEFTSSGARLTNHLLAGRGEAFRFDFNQSQSYEFLKGIDHPLIITVHAVEQLPSAARMVENMVSMVPSGTSIVHFEPAYTAHGEGTLNDWRRAYTEANDYNRDLLESLRAWPDAVVDLDVQPDALGLNPLNPTSVITWRRA